MPRKYTKKTVSVPPSFEVAPSTPVVLSVPSPTPVAKVSAINVYRLNSGDFVRTFSREIHGVHFEDLCKSFCEAPGNGGPFRTLQVI